jgi:hypothetical protein
MPRYCKTWMAGTSPAMTSLRRFPIHVSNSQESRHSHSRGTRVSEGCIAGVPRKTEGAGNAGARPHPQPCVQMENARKQVTTGTPKRSGIPCAMVLRLLRDLPGVPGLIAPVARELLHALDPSVGGPGPHDLTVRPGALRPLAHRARPSHPAPRVVTIAIRPSVAARDGATEGQ